MFRDLTKLVFFRTLDKLAQVEAAIKAEQDKQTATRTR